MTTPNTLPANGGVSDAEVRKALERVALSYHTGNIEKMFAALTDFAQSRQPSAQQRTAKIRGFEYEITLLPDGELEVREIGPCDLQPSAQGGEAGLRAAATLAYKALCEESAAYADPIAHVEEAIAALQAALAPPPAGGGKEALSDAERRYQFLRQDAGICDGRPFIAISEAGAISQWTGVFADEKIDAAIRAGKKG